jgi:uncharacterized membrane protein
MLPRHHRLYRHFSIRQRLYAAALFGLAVALLLPPSLMAQPVTRALIGWNAGAVLYLALCMVMMSAATMNSMKTRARMQGEKRYVVIALVFCSALAMLGTIAAELSAASNLHGAEKTGHVLLAALTVFTTWLVIQVIFAINYAHAYYLVEADGPKGLLFPDGKDINPGYFDFFYASCIIGTSAQTADVSFNTTAARRIALAHSVLAFFFNTILLALTINVAAALL